MNLCWGKVVGESKTGEPFLISLTHQVRPWTQDSAIRSAFRVQLFVS
jgi:hypothetical protein